MKRDETPRVSDWQLERLAAGDLPPAEAASLRARLAAAGELARLDALAESNRALLDAYPPAAVADEVKRRLHLVPARKAKARAVFMPTLALVAAGATAAMLLVPEPATRGADPPSVVSDDENRAKGPAHLIVYRQTGAGPQLLRAGSAVHPGDALQVRYQAGGQRYGVIASRDARGSLTLHLPEGGHEAARLQNHGKTPSAFELDDSTGFEEFVLITAKHPFTVDRVHDLLREDASPDPQFQIFKIRFAKVLP